MFTFAHLFALFERILFDGIDEYYDTDPQEDKEMMCILSDFHESDESDDDMKAYQPMLTNVQISRRQVAFC